MQTLFSIVEVNRTPHAIVPLNSKLFKQLINLATNTTPTTIACSAQTETTGKLQEKIAARESVILDCLKTNSGCNGTELYSIAKSKLKCSKPTTMQSLQRLIDKGLVVRKGKTSKTKYFLS